MTWKVTDPLTERAKFVAMHDQGLYSMAALCQRFTISRKTGYKWLARYQQNGLDGLLEHRRAPKACPQAMAPATAPALLEARRLHPTWAPRKAPALDRQEAARLAPAGRAERAARADAPDT